MFCLTLIFAAAIISAITAQRSPNGENASIQDAIIYAKSVTFVFADKNTGALKNALNSKMIEHPAFVSYIDDGTGLDAKVEMWAPIGKNPWVSFRGNPFIIGSQSWVNTGNFRKIN